jgi:1-aminocyclopropane-1-carboxylate deaminase/D-cysteine desulfhydrase-like pyridoxal-dependent ACC family enzyme
VIEDPYAITPVEEHGGYLVKRDDLFHVGGIRGGKVRTCLTLASEEWVEGLITAGARRSPQCAIVARVGEMMGVPVRVHMPEGAETPESIYAAQHGAEVVRHRAGYNTVIIKRARDDTMVHPGWREIPFGMECEEAATNAQIQAAALPFGDFARVVVPVGSGMTMAGVLRGVAGRAEVLGVEVGADASERISRWAPFYVYDLRRSVYPYDKAVPGTLGSLVLDEIYESKAIGWLADDDLFWCVGIRPSQS